MASFNKVILAGHLTRDPESRFLSTGTAVSEFGIGINRKWKDADGNQKEEVGFFDLTAFGRTAETINQYFKKGSAILVEGRLKLDQWEDKQSGQKRSKVKIMVESFSFIGSNSKEGGEQQSSPPARRQTARPPAADTAAQPDAPEDDDVPF